MELLEVAVADLAAGLVAFPDQRRIAARLELRLGVPEWRVPGPRVGAGDAHAALEQVQRRLPPHAGAGGHVVRLTVSGAGACVDDDDLQRTHGVLDPRQLALDIFGRDDVAVRPLP